MLLGCIADDFTGATDLANMLVKGGMRTVQTIGVPQGTLPDVDAVVVALKSRTIAPEEAVAQSLAALQWLQGQGCKQFYFKYCSTFDSTPRGNIGPVIDALAADLGVRGVVVCPVFPGTRYEDWALPDPAGQDIATVRPIRDEIRGRVLTLLSDLGVEPVTA